MNSTRWATLTEFVKYLGRTGKCKVEETPKGWFITYIDRDSETLFKEKMKNKRIKLDMVDEERQEREIQKQIEIAASSSVSSTNPLSNSEDNTTRELNLEAAAAVGKVGFALGSSYKDNVTSNGSGNNGSGSTRLVFEELDKDNNNNNNNRKIDNNGSKVSGNSALEELMREEEKVKEKMNRKDYWLCEGIIVKVMSKALADKGYNKQKGVVRKVIDKYVGEIEMLEKKHVLRVDQDELETVIPQIGGLVRIVNGAYRGSNARLLGVDTDKFCAQVKIEKGVYDGRVLNAIDYEDVCKLA